MEAKSILKEFRKHRKLLENLRENMATPRLKGMWNFFYRQTETQTIIFRVLPVNHIVAKANPGKPVEAETYEEVVGIGLYIMKECSHTDKHITSIIHDLGIGSKDGKPTRQSYVDDAMVGYINPALDFIERELEELAKTEMEEEDRKSIAVQARADVKMGARVKAEVIKGKHKDVVPSDETADQPTIEEASIGGYSICDQPTDVDSLGFEPYTTAIAEFLSHGDTRPPITMSIEGEWGSGKSSFMLQLEKKLVSKGGLIVKFSPWRHEEEYSVWAAFVLTFTDQLSKQLYERSGLRECLKVRFKLLWERFDWHKGWPAVAKVGAQCLAYIFILIGVLVVLWAGGIPYLKHIWTKLFLTFSSTMYVAWKGLKSVQDFVGNPFEHDLKKYIQTPDYTGRTPFIEQFHKDFKRVVEAYAGGKKVYVFIDDLDRCAVPKAAELMQAINLMISDEPQLIFVLGMDREKVAAGLAVKHKEVIPYLNPRLVGQEANERWDSNELTGLRYGYSFIEKFVQLPFSIPRPTEDQIEKLMDSIADKARVEGSEMILSKDDVGVTVKPDKGGGRELGKEEEPERSKESLERSKAQEEGQRWLELSLAEDSEQVKQIVKMVAPALDCNPRRIKQFINLFRLRAYIAYETELLALPENIGDSGCITLEQLGKIVAIALKWPLFLDSLGRDGSLLEKLANVAEKHKADAPVLDDVSKRGAQDRKLIELIRYGCLDKEGKQDLWEWSTYTLSEVDINKLLQVSPQVKSISEVDSTIETIESEGESESYQSVDEEEKGPEPSAAMREYQVFYSELLQRLKEKRPEITREKAFPQHYLSLPTGYGGIHFEWAFHGRPRSWFEVGLHFEKSSKDENLKVFNHLAGIKYELKKRLKSLELRFEPNWGTRCARSYVRKNEGEMSEKLKDWVVKTTVRFYDVFKPRLDKYMRGVRGIDIV